VPTDLLVIAQLDWRSTARRVTSTRRMESRLDNDYARRVLERQCLTDLAVAAIPGPAGARAAYENHKHEVLKSVPKRYLEGVALLVDVTAAWHFIAGGREAITETVHPYWRPATEFDL
jgi:hypothetical protein